MLKPAQVNVEAPKVQRYLDSLPSQTLPDSLRRHMSAVLAGSAGWGVKTSASEHFDWDLHLLLPDAMLEAEVDAGRLQTTVDDQKNSPKVFAQIHSLSWLATRLTSQDRKWWPLYHWICGNGAWVYQTPEASELMDAGNLRFEAERDALLRSHFITYKVRRLDMKSSDKNNQALAASIYTAEANLAVLQSFSLLHGCSYPYPKWLAVWVRRFDGGEELVRMSQAWIEARTASERQKAGSAVDAYITDKFHAKFGPQNWIDRWWEYLEN